jgi:hypothetical protein
MYVIPAEWSVVLLEGELADDALVALGVQALLAGFWVALVSVYLYLAECAFGVERRGVVYGFVGRPEEFLVRVHDPEVVQRVCSGWRDGDSRALNVVPVDFRYLGLELLDGEPVVEVEDRVPDDVG